MNRLLVFISTRRYRALATLLYRISDCNTTRNWMLTEDQWTFHLMSKSNHATGKTIANSHDTPHETQHKTWRSTPGKRKIIYQPSLHFLRFYSCFQAMFFANVYITISNLSMLSPLICCFFCEMPSTSGMAATTNAPYKPASTTWLEGVLGNSFLPPQRHWEVSKSIKVGSWEKP